MTKRRDHGEGSITVTDIKGRKYYRAFIYDHNGQRLSKASYRRADVVDWLNTAKYDLQQGILISDGNKPFGLLFHQWLQITKKPPHTTPQTYEKATRHYHLRTKGYKIHDINLNMLTTTIVQDHINELLKDHSETIVRGWGSIVNSCMKYYMSEGFISRNPIFNVKLPRKRDKNRRNVKYYTKDEQKKIVNHILEQDHTTYNKYLVLDTMILTGFMTGLRISEVIGLRWSDHLGDKLTVERQYKKVPIVEDGEIAGREYKYLPLKTKNSERIVPLPEILLERLDLLKALQDEHKENKPHLYKDEDVLFADNLGVPINMRRPNRRLKRLSEELDTKYLTFHSLRHTYATRLFELGTEVKTVQMLLGHADITDTLDIYTHVTNEVKIDAVKGLDNMFK